MISRSRSFVRSYSFVVRGLSCAAMACVASKSGRDIPLDLRHLRHVKYLNNAEGRGALTTALQGRMLTILGH